MIWLVGRHPGALDWAASSGLAWDRTLRHWEIPLVAAGDQVYGTLPCHLAAKVCAAGAEYWHLCVSIPEAFRGRELTAPELELFGARFVRYEIQTKEPA